MVFTPWSCRIAGRVPPGCVRVMLCGRCFLSLPSGWSFVLFVASLAGGLCAWFPSVSVFLVFAWPAPTPCVPVPLWARTPLSLCVSGCPCPACLLAASFPSDRFPGPLFPPRAQPGAVSDCTHAPGEAVARARAVVGGPSVGYDSLISGQFACVEALEIVHPVL